MRRKKYLVEREATIYFFCNGSVIKEGENRPVYSDGEVLTAIKL